MGCMNLDYMENMDWAEALDAIARRISAHAMKHPTDPASWGPYERAKSFAPWLIKHGYADKGTDGQWFLTEEGFQAFRAEVARLGLKDGEAGHPEL